MRAKERRFARTVQGVDKTILLNLLAASYDFINLIK